MKPTKPPEPPDAAAPAADPPTPEKLRVSIKFNHEELAEGMAKFQQGHPGTTFKLNVKNRAPAAPAPVAEEAKALDEPKKLFVSIKFNHEELGEAMAQFAKDHPGASAPRIRVRSDRTATAPPEALKAANEPNGRPVEERRRLPDRRR